MCEGRRGESAWSILETSTEAQHDPHGLTFCQSGHQASVKSSEALASISLTRDVQEAIVAKRITNLRQHIRVWIMCHSTLITYVWG